MTADLALTDIDPKTLQGILSQHLAMYRRKTPFYQATMLQSILSLWVGRACRLLDIGGGTGVIAEAMAELFPVDCVHAVDLVDRFCATLNVATTKYDGNSLPFGDASFNAATLNNVLHHVPANARAGLLCEIRRVVDGPLYIKDHESRSGLDNLRLAAMDAIGNLPFGGMVRARYLGHNDWESLARASGYRIAARAEPGLYRRGLYALLFPNRLEVTMRFEPA